MNDPNKRINVNLSSLLSLKAELLRKQSEVSQTKASRETSDEYSANKSSTTSRNAATSSKKHNLKEVRKEKDATIYEHEDSAMLEKSQRVLEAKSKFYERMSRSGGKLNSDDNCLVLFNRKQQEQRTVPEHYVESESSDSEASASSLSDDEAEKHEDGVTADDSDDDWVEYIDCLGRTRKCLRSDLEVTKQRDEELAASMPKRLDQSKANWMIDTKGSHADDDDEQTTIGPLPPESIFNDGCSLMSKHDEQRANWERKEQENVGKIDMHYQDVFFDEARQHGVGYYAFSTDEEERKRQQQELNEARKRTITEQERRDALRAQREKIIADRVRAAKNRQRARLGLPPLTAEDADDDAAQKDNVSDNKKETKDERKLRRRAEKLQRKKDKEEAEREQQRQQHIRPWDKEKSGVTSDGASSTAGFEAASVETEWTYKPERLPMSQEEWNEQKRAERNPEFAPVAEPQSSYGKHKRTAFTSMPPPPPPPPSSSSSTADAHFNMMPPSDDGFSTFQTSKRNKAFQRRNFDAYHNESKATDEPPRRVGAQIPPPVDLDADSFLPSHAKRSKSNSELEKSVEAGLRFLREHSDKGITATKSSWTAKADY